MSDWTFEHLRNELRLAAEAREAQYAVGVAEQEYLIAHGSIQDGLVMMERPFYRLMRTVGTNDDAGNGAYSIELQDGMGQPLFVRYFDLGSDTLDLNPTGGHFLEELPWQQGTARIVIKEGQTTLLSTEVSANAPQVTLVSPNGGERWPAHGEATIAWEGSDADGDPLRYTVQYSTDAGQTWSAIAVNLAEQSVTLDLGSLAGSEEALVRVVASDGVNTARDDSDEMFSVGQKPPEVAIVSPADGALVEPGAMLLLQGTASDVEDGGITDESAFEWYSDREGFLGAGRTLILDDIYPGEHLITLQVTDSDLFTSEAQVSVFLGTRPRLPLVMK
jgi:hypothetical protein